MHRLLTRLLAIHAPQTGPPTIKALWQAAEELVRGLPDKEGVAGDWNQVSGVEQGWYQANEVGTNGTGQYSLQACRAGLYRLSVETELQSVRRGQARQRLG